MKKFAVLLIIALTGLLAACSSSSSSSTTVKAAVPKTTEIIYGKDTGKAALADPPSFKLTFTGPVTATGPITLSGGNPAPGQSKTIVTTAGNIAVTLDSAGVSTSTADNSPPCQVQYSTTIPLTVNGAKSTGKFAGAAGTGHVVVAMSGKLPLLKNGQCNQGDNVNPTAASALATFTVTIAPLTLKA